MGLASMKRGMPLRTSPYKIVLAYVFSKLKISLGSQSSFQVLP